MGADLLIVAAGRGQSPNGCFGHRTTDPTAGDPPGRAFGRRATDGGPRWRHVRASSDRASTRDPLELRGYRPYRWIGRIASVKRPNRALGDGPRDSHEADRAGMGRAEAPRSAAPRATRCGMPLSIGTGDVAHLMSAATATATRLGLQDERPPRAERQVVAACQLVGWPPMRGEEDRPLAVGSNSE